MTTHFTKLALVLGLGILPLAAQPYGHPGKAGGPRPASQLDRMADQLKLTEEQKAQIQAIQKKHLETSTARLQAAAQARDAYREAAQKPETPSAQLKTLYQARSDKAFELVLERRAMTNEIRALLTPEQRTQLDTWKAYQQARQAYGKRGRKGSRY